MCKRKKFRRVLWFSIWGGALIIFTCLFFEYSFELILRFWLITKTRDIEFSIHWSVTILINIYTSGMCSKKNGIVRVKSLSSCLNCLINYLEKAWLTIIIILLPCKSNFGHWCFRIYNNHDIIYYYNNIYFLLLLFVIFFYYFSRYNAQVVAVARYINIKPIHVIFCYKIFIY